MTPKHFRILMILVAAYSLTAVHSTAQSRAHILYKFGNGDAPAGLIAVASKLYGVAGGSTCGYAFELQPSNAGGEWIETVLYKFSGPPADACEPNGLTAGPDGKLYGISSDGGASFYGTVFELDPPATPEGTWAESLLHSFSPAEGGVPLGNIVVAPSGALYGAKPGGGANGQGDVFELQPPATPGGEWTESAIYSFTGRTDAAIPVSLTMGPHGVLYGTSEMGGNSVSGAGTIFQVKPPGTPGGAWTESVIYSFQGDLDGSSPFSPVVVTSDGIVYGTTFGTLFVGSYAGPAGVGSVFELAPPAYHGGTWTKTTIQQFGEGKICGPDSPLILREGNIYGLSCLGAGGIVFELQPPATPREPWTTIDLLRFTNGQQPSGTFVMNESGTIFGTTFGIHTVPGTAFVVAP